MNSTAREIESKVQLWSILGPIAIACILLIVIVRSAATVALPMAAIGGILVCYKWKWRGLVVALGALALVFGAQFSLSTVDDWLWSSILALTIASAFIVTTLAFDESGHAFDALEDQSERHKETINQLDERLRVFQEKWLQERQDFQAHIQQLKDQIEEQDQHAQAAEKGVSLARDELAANEEHHRKLLQELFEARQQAHHLELRLALVDYQMKNSMATQEEDPFTVSQTSPQIVDNSAEIISKHEAETVALRGMLEESEMQRRLCLQELQQHADELASLKEQHEISIRNFTSAEEQQTVQHAVTQELNEHIETLTREKKLLESTLVRLQGELEALKDQEEGKLQTLQSYQETISRLQIGIEAKEAALEQEANKVQTLKSSFEARERDLILQVEDLARKWANVSQQIADWQRKLEDYQHVCEKASTLQQQVGVLSKEKNHLEAESQKFQSRIAELEKSHVDALTQAETALAAAQSVDAGTSNIPDQDVTAALREIRRMSGLYNQLKDQFAEKTETLAKTRKELFLVQEELNALHRENLEAHVYGDSEIGKEMCRLLAAVEDERYRLEQEHRIELENLHDIIGSLIFGKSAANKL